MRVWGSLKGSTELGFRVEGSQKGSQKSQGSGFRVCVSSQVLCRYDGVYSLGF